MRLNIVYNGESVGQLLDSTKGIFFEYDEGFIDKEIELSPVKLKLQKRVYGPWDMNFLRLPGLAYDSLPDRYGMAVLRRRFNELGEANPSPLQMLAFLGTRTMGALTYEPANGDPDESRAVDLVHAAQSARAIIEMDHASELDPALVASGATAGGARPKVLVAMSQSREIIVTGSDCIPDGLGAWLLKLETDESHSTAMGRLEMAYSLMAKAAGITIPETCLVPGPDGLAHFGIRRFDRDINDPNVRYHTHTFAGMFQLDFQSPSLDYDGLLRMTRALTRDATQVAEVFRRMIFNVLGYNHDDHAKNFSFLMAPDGRWRLSPAYDLLFCENYHEGNWMMVGGKRNGITYDDFLRLGEVHSLSRRTVDEMIDDVRVALGKWRTFAKKTGVGSGYLETVASCIKKVDVGPSPSRNVP
ncbi:type II toxin-antitoxin system HipA family toxin [Rubellicoccus peritrichatus]|uniref:Type II toxin-antitoxin system HipA family toxin n=1 Tax=Rubellicoccus peritrichatus TaxID=3080537 RepID=A0AAQ3LAR0_9BACT|nr:type II toxin-antitoxin system HipA family toxin [Puniceicoccus sp. CR14]WOO42674.1 type II toxin-antitoxin system HipA family toxin [Puniceicoccus sp. CR14]